MTTSGRTPCKAQGFMEQEVDGQVVLFNPVTERSMHLNPTAVMVWALCDGRRTEHQIIKTLSEAYPESAPIIEEQVPEVMDSMEENGLLVRR